MSLEPSRIGAHSVRRDFLFDPTLLLIHLKFVNFQHAIDRQKLIHELYQQGFGGRGSRWRHNQNSFKVEFDRLSSLPFRKEEMPHYRIIESEFIGNYPYKLCGDSSRKKADGTYTYGVQFMEHISDKVARELQGYQQLLPERFKTIPLFAV